MTQRAEAATSPPAPYPLKAMASVSHPFCKTTVAPGIRVVSEAIPSVRSLSVGIWVFNGSRDEAPDESGISHFIEHMVFKGTARRKMHQIARRMEAVGGYLNAFTGKEYTCYYAHCLDTHLERAIDTVCDLVLDPTFPEKELEKEKEVVLEEMMMYEDSPEEYVFDRFDAALFGSHPLGRPVIGFPETVRSFTRSQLLDYLGRKYTPNRIVLAVAGNVRHEKVHRIAEKVFRRLDRPSGPREAFPLNGEAPRHLVEERPIKQAHLVIGCRAYDAHHPRRYALSVLNTLLGGGMSSRLNQNIREKYGFCYNVYSFVNQHSDTGDFGVYMGTDVSKVARARTLIHRELDRLAQAPVSSRMLRQAIMQVKGGIMLGLENMGSRMMRLGRQELYYENYESLDAVLQRLDAVSREDVQQVAQELFVPERFSSAVLLPKNGN